MKYNKFSVLIILSYILISNSIFAGTIDVEKSIQYYNNKVQNGTASVDDYYWMGHLYFYQLKDYRKAAEYFLRGSELDKTRADVLVGAGMSYVRLKEFEEALKYLKKAEELDPNMAVAFHQAGKSYYNMGKFELAKKEFETAYALTPDDAATCGLYGDTLYFLGDYDNAEKLLLKAIELGFKPGIYDIYYKLAAVYDKKGDTENEMLYMKKCIEENPKFVGAYNDLGAIYYEKKQYNEAIKYFKKAIKLPNKIPQSFYGLARVYKDLEKTKEALKYLDEAEKCLQRFDNRLKWPKVVQGQIDELRKEILSSKK